MALDKIKHNFEFNPLPGFVRLLVTVEVPGKEVKYQLLLSPTECKSLAARFECFADEALRLKRESE